MASDIEVISIKEMAFFADAEHMINLKTSDEVLE